MTEQYVDQGVKISPAMPKPEQPVKLFYNGVLAQKGAAEIIARVGFNQWKDVRDYRMVKTPAGFEVSLIPPFQANGVSICFRDAADNWDNNSGSDYTYPISLS